MNHEKETNRKKKRLWWGKRQLVLLASIVILVLSASAASTVVSAASEVQRDKVEAFVERLYYNLLGREVDAEGLEYWTEVLVSGADTGANVAADIVFSTELVSRNLSDEEFVDCMYLTVFDRAPEMEGRDYWLGVLAAGESRNGVGQNLLNSAEFGQICEQYGIQQGQAGVPSGDAGSEDSGNTEMVQNFVKRLYSILLNREVDAEGLTYWSGVLINRQDTGARVASDIVFSEELADRNLSDEEYVDCLYKTVFDRAPEEEGKAYWLSVLAQGESRNNVGRNLLNSPEFGTVCNSYHIEQGIVGMVPEPTETPKPAPTEAPEEVSATYRQGDWSYAVINKSTIVIKKYHGADAVVEVPQEIKGKPVTRIGGSAFYSCDSLISIVLPETLTRIETSAFAACSSLTGIILPETVTEIGAFAFNGCSSLVNVIIPAGVTSIGQGAFYNCRALVAVELPEGLESITSGIFEGCERLNRVKLPEGIMKIGSRAFTGCISLKTITIPESVASIDYAAFASCSSLGNISLPKGIKNIGNKAFWNCTSLAVVTMTEYVTEIGLDVFEGCGDNLKACVKAGSYAEQYMKNNMISYVIYE